MGVDAPGHGDSNHLGMLRWFAKVRDKLVLTESGNEHDDKTNGLCTIAG